MATSVIMPRQGQSVESCILTEWKVAPGEVVEEGTVLAVIETDKASFDLESTAAGTVLELFWEADDDVPVLANVLAIGEEGEDCSDLRPQQEAAPAPAPEPSAAPAAPQAAAPAAATPTAPVAPSPGASSEAGVSPRARKLALRSGIDPEAIQGTGPGGRVIERDVEAVVEGRPRLSASALAVARGGDLEPPARGKGLAGMALACDMLEPGAIEGAKVEPVKGIRKLIAERMMQSLGNTAQFTLNSTFDATAVQTFRKQRREEAKESGGPKITLNDLIAHALLETLKRHPLLNAHFLGERIARFEEVHLGVAVDTPRGLMVPVLRSACAKSLEDLSSGIKRMVESCIEGTILPDQLSGGTFTLTNLGMLGIDHFTPVINPPEAAILGVGGISLRPVRSKDGEISYAECITLSLTIDHQAVDGAPAARFLKDLVDTLNNYPGANAGNDKGDE
jgi:pyruvate dehydrogenase E2 component (dihydrolipoamide acetyltransferase)